MLTPSDKATPNRDVIVTELEGEAVLLNMDTRTYFSLNTTGVSIWKGLDEGLTLGQIADRLLRDYEVTEERAQQCVIDLVTQLNLEQLVSLVRD